jgi:post-segregation antitoxin (ccd killing protein)
MARVYVKLDAKREKVTVPVSAELLTRLKNYAVNIQVSYTEAARNFIEQGLNTGGKANDKHSGTDKPL